MIREAPSIPVSPLNLDVVDAIIFADLTGILYRKGNRAKRMLLGSTLKAVLLVIHRHEGLPLPADRIAELAAVSRESVGSATLAMRELGLCTITHGGFRNSQSGRWANVYRINRDRLKEMRTKVYPFGVGGGK